MNRFATPAQKRGTANATYLLSYDIDIGIGIGSFVMGMFQESIGLSAGFAVTAAAYLIGVDRLNAVMDATEREVLSVPSLLNGENNCLHNIVVAGQKQFIILIDVNSLIPHEEKAEIHQLIAGNA